MEPLWSIRSVSAAVFSAGGELRCGFPVAFFCSVLWVFKFKGVGDAFVTLFWALARHYLNFKLRSEKLQLFEWLKCIVRISYLSSGCAASPQINKEKCKASDVRSGTIKMQIFAAFIRGVGRGYHHQISAVAPKALGQPRLRRTDFFPWHEFRYKWPIKMKHIHDFSDRKPEY